MTKLSRGHSRARACHGAGAAAQVPKSCEDSRLCGFFVWIARIARERDEHSANKFGEPWDLARSRSSSEATAEKWRFQDELIMRTA